jgi:hypothetical protein
MTTLTNNKNFLSPVGFQLVINRNKFANIEYFCTGVTLPSIDIAETSIPYRNLNSAVAGDRINFSELSITFNVTEDMENYIETFNWMHDSLGKDNVEENAMLLILNSHNNVSKRIKFNGIFPTSLDSLDFNTQNESLEYLQATVSFKYTNFEIE